jgi:hypothetical protein
MRFVPASGALFYLSGSKSNYVCDDVSNAVTLADGMATR